MSINTFKVRDGRIRVYKKYVYKLCSVLFQPSLLRAARSCSIFSGLLLVSQSLGSILSRPQTVTLSFYPSLRLKHTTNTHILIHTHTRAHTHAHTHTHTRAHTHARTHSLVLRYSRHRYIRIFVWSTHALCSAFITTLTTHHHNIIIVII